MGRAFIGKFVFVALVAGLLGLAWGLKGTQFGQDLAGGAELRYGVTQRVSQQYEKYLRYRSEASDPEKRKEKEDRIEDIKRLLSTAGDAEHDRLSRDKNELEFALDPERIAEAIEELKRQQEAVGAGAEIIRRRIDASGIADIEVRTVGRSQLLIRVPFQRKPDETQDEAEKRFARQLREIQDRVEKQGVLRFHLALKLEERSDDYKDAVRRAEEGRSAPQGTYYVLPKKQYEEVKGKLAERGITDPLEGGYLPWSESEEEVGRAAKQEARGPLLLEREHVLDGTIVDRAYHHFGDKGWEISLDFTAAGQGKFERVTAEHYKAKRQLAIVLDNECHSAPAIQSRIAGSAVITGSFTQTEAKNLAAVLTAGSLPVQIQFDQKSVVGPSLGRDSIQRGMTAIVMGAGAVLLFILLYYLSGGAVANIAMALNLVILMGALAAFNAKLTLPGIAGVLLTVGMAIDANVLIFERIREEKERGRTLRLAVQAGYDRAFVTIIDANMTTLIAAVVLYWFGTGPVRGFAVTLTLGILASLFTALYASRAIIEFLVAKNWISEFAMLRAVGRTRVSFMRLRPVAYLLSVVVVSGGLYAFFSYPHKYGIDFEGGTMLKVALREPMPDTEMRAVANAALAEMQSRENERSVEQKREALDFGKVRAQAYQAEAPDRSSQFSLIMRMGVGQLEEYTGLLSERLGDRLRPVAPFPSQETIGQSVSAELGSSAMRALFFALLLIFLYIVLRFEFNPSFGVGAVAALAHDVAITAGAMAAADWAGIVPAKIDLPAVAALLTIVGYSLNDTIVVFDRIRELRLEGKSRPLREVIDESLNAVLSRTIITSLTTLLAVGSLFVVGGDATKGFAFAMMVGVAVGTYSSVFIAAPLVVAWEGVRVRPGLKKALAGAAIALLVLGLGGLIARSVWTASEYRLRDECYGKIEDVRLGLSTYAARHEGQYPPDLKALVGDYLKDEAKLAGPGAGSGIAYNYVSGLRRDDPADAVLMYDGEGVHAYGGHVVFVDGRLVFWDRRRIEAAVAKTANKIGSLRGRKVEIVPAEVAGKAGP